jgi:hypothetical protein
MPSMVPRLCRTFQARHDLVGLGLQSVAGQDCSSLAEDLVAGGPAAAKVVIVERGQIVMHERVGMKHLDRRAQFINAFRQFAAHHSCRLHAENGPQPFASGKNAMAHGLVDGTRILRGRGQQSFQCGVGKLLALEQSFFQHGR